MRMKRQPTIVFNTVTNSESKQKWRLKAGPVAESVKSIPRPTHLYLKKSWLLRGQQVSRW